MPRHIINIRGTSGSGKSTLVRQLMDAHGPVTPLGSPKILGYQCGPDLRVVGRYTNACGGCDGIKTQDEVSTRVREYAQHGHVVFEGLLVSGIVERYRALAEELGGFTFAFLNTPLEVCLERVHQRRAAKGNDRPLDPTLTTAKWERCRQAARRLEGVAPVVWLPWEDPLPAVEDILRSPLGTVRGDEMERFRWLVVSDDLPEMEMPQLMQLFKTYVRFARFQEPFAEEGKVFLVGTPDDTPPDLPPGWRWVLRNETCRHASHAA